MVALVRFRKPRSRTSLRRRVFCLRPNEVLNQHKSLFHLMMLVSLLFLLNNRRPDLVTVRETLRKGIFLKIQDLLQLLKNIFTALHGNVISQRFKCPPPSLTEYIAMMNI